MIGLLFSIQYFKKDLALANGNDWRWVAGLLYLRPKKAILVAIARTGEPGQDRQKRQSGHYIHDRKQKTRRPEQYRKDRTARTGQHPG
jgi:hypothetical protein